MKKTLTLALIVLIAQLGFSQGFERPRSVEKEAGIKKDSSQQEEEKFSRIKEPEIFQQLSINASEQLRVNLKALKLYAQVGKDSYIDFYVLSSLPTNSIALGDSVEALGNELQSIYGGLVNSYLSKSWYLNKEDDRNQRGLQFELRGGYKLTNSSKDQGASDVFLHSAQGAAEIRFLIPLKKETTDDNMAGIIQLKASAQGVYSNSNEYQLFFTNDQGEKPSNFLGTINLEGSIHVVDQFYVSGGGSFSSLNQVGNVGYFKITYSKPY